MILLNNSKLQLGFAWLAVVASAFGHPQPPPVVSAPTPVSFFRSDSGVAGPACGTLPDDFSQPGALAWRVEADPGQSTPILCGGRIFFTSFRSEPAELATVALDLPTGQRRWKKVVPAARIETFHPQMGNAAVATPACDGSRLYVFFGSYGLVCYDLQGATLWEHKMGPFRDEYGAASSPVVIDDKIVLCQDHDTDSFLVALNRLTGETVWKVVRPDAVRSYSTPVIWTNHGHLQLLVAGALELAGYDPGTGERVWWTHGLARIVIPVPVTSGEMIYMASWAPGGDPAHRLLLDSWSDALAKWDKDKNGRLTREEIDDREVLDRFTRMDLDQSSDLDQQEWERHAAVFQRAQNALLALKPSGEGELREQDLLWKHQRGIPYVASPLLDNGILWMVKDGGIVTKLEAASGKVLQEERLPGAGAYYASPVTGDRKVYFASEQGVISVLANDREWNPVSSHNLREKTYATPVLDHGRVYIRTQKALYCYQHP